MSCLRAIRQLTIASSRTIAHVRPLSSRVALRTAVVGPTFAARRAFSVSTRAFGEGASDVLLTQRLGEELEYELEAAVNPDAEPEFLKEFKSQGIWTIEDQRGNEEVTLTRTFGNETIRAMFSILDIQDAEDPDFTEEEEEPEGDEKGKDEALNEFTHPIRVSFTFTKSNADGAINVDTMCQEGSFIVDNIAYYKEPKLATDLTAEADWARRGLYLGPHFDTLDATLQNEFEAFLQERGIGDSLAMFIPEYAEHKELKEYVKWLENVKKFVEQ